MPRWGDEADSDNEGDVGLSPVAEAGDGTAAADGTAASASGSSSAPKIPPTHTSKVDSRGIKIVTSYRAHPSRMDQLLKTVTRVKVTTHVVREARAVSDRRRWKKFGQAALDEDTSNVTIQSRDDVHLEDPNADSDLQDEDAGKALAGNLNAFWAKQQRRQLERKYDVDGDIDGPAGEADGGGWQKVGEKAAAGGAAGGSKYVPPSQRGLAAGAAGGAGGGAKSLAAMAEKVGDGGGGGPGGSRFGQDRDQNTIRVTNISEDTTEADLQELFQPFGRISRVYLAKDKETMISRGFAFISFVHREDATRAMEKLQGYGYDHLILKVSYIFIHTYIYIYVIHIYIYMSAGCAF
jgi:translation initiation factor 3 subunit G